MRSPQIPSMLLIPSLISRLVFHSSWDDGALDAAATVAAAVYTYRNDGYASNMLSGDLWQQTPGVTDEMESGGND